jgi:transposase InsO family protein
MLVFGVLRPEQALAALASEWNLFLFFLGLMLISGLADAAGFFDAAGAVAVAAAKGSGRLLLLTVFRGPWRSLEQVELATAEWIEWWNHRRLHGATDDRPPAEYEDLYYRQRDTNEVA